ncbi:hypothetical protein AOQ84DRAFT_356656 [Glonium stellatum]|uniref:Uncharacterized protein n=1 Tax=Glonium stellatum TaxID=574774 RepID=A0A8E2ESQ5_9PEZI|nr:hypothetical protein AOQ84DRAFT_356656 [Glonium stellatum]
MKQRLGPFLKRPFGTQAYELELPEYWKIHPIISIEQLEPAPNDPDPFERPVDERPRTVTDDA